MKPGFVLYFFVDFDFFRCFWGVLKFIYGLVRFLWCIIDALG